MLISLKDTLDSFVTCKPKVDNSSQPKMRAASLGPGTEWAGMEITQCYSASCGCGTEGAVLGRAAELCSWAPLWQAALAGPLTTFLLSCLHACKLLASWKALASFSANTQAPLQVTLILYVLCKHTYDMFTCMHMLGGARFQHIVCFSVNNPIRAFFFAFCDLFCFEIVSLTLGILLSVHPLS